MPSRSPRMPTRSGGRERRGVFQSTGKTTRESRGSAQMPAAGDPMSRMSGTSAEICGLPRAGDGSAYAAAPERVSLGKCFSPKKKVSAASQPEGAATDVILTNSRFPARISKATICGPTTTPRLALSAASSRLGPRPYIDTTVDSEGHLRALGPPPCSTFRRKLDPIVSIAVMYFPSGHNPLSSLPISSAL